MSRFRAEWTPDRVETRFCGAECPVGEPYCDVHHVLCHQPVPARKPGARFKFAGAK